jgi:hypothetical protein
MRNEFFIERYANERHQAHLSEAARDRRARTAGAPALERVSRFLRSRAASVLWLTKVLARSKHQQLASRTGVRVQRVCWRMNGRQSQRIASSARFEGTYRELIAALLLALLSSGAAFTLGVAADRLIPHTAQDTGRQMGPTTVAQQRVLDLWFDEPTVRNGLPGP